MTIETQKAMEARARFAAQHAGWVARKTTWRKGYSDNRGGFQLLRDGTIIGGEKFDLSAEDVMDLAIDEQKRLIAMGEPARRAGYEARMRALAKRARARK